MKQKRWSRRKIKKQLTWYSFIAVSIVTLLLLVYLPMLTTIKYSMFDVSVIGFGEKFAGFKNYKILLTQSTFLKSLWNTIVLALLGLITIPLGFILAALINGLGAGRTQSFFRIGFYLPNIITGVSVILMFQAVLQGDGGLLNIFLSRILGRNILIGWLSSANYAKIGATILWCWMNLGYSMLINLASMQSVPAEIYDAAAVDGASGWKKLCYITVPSMRGCFSFLLVTTMINGLSRFTDLFIIGGNSSAGVPGGVLQTILMYIYQFSFEVPNYGISSAGAMILFAMVFAFTMLNVKLTGFLDEEK